MVVVLSPSLHGSWGQKVGPYHESAWVQRVRAWGDASQSPLGREGGGAYDPSGPCVGEGLEDDLISIPYSAKFSRHLYFVEWPLKTISLHNVRGMTAYRKPRL